MSSVVNLKLLEPGARIGLSNGSTAEVVSKSDGWGLDFRPLLDRAR
jgi:hypothetical protein